MIYDFFLPALTSPALFCRRWKNFKLLSHNFPAKKKFFYMLLYVNLQKGIQIAAILPLFLLHKFTKVKKKRHKKRENACIFVRHLFDICQAHHRQLVYWEKMKRHFKGKS
jgi:hypothetical protein